jgi:hypothetical protein
MHAENYVSICIQLLCCLQNEEFDKVDKGMDCFLPLNALIKRGQIPRSSDKNLTMVYLNEMRASVIRVMVSHRWLSPSTDPSLAHPDDNTHSKQKLLCICFERLGASGWIRNNPVVWIDFCE